MTTTRSIDPAEADLHGGSAADCAAFGAMLKLDKPVAPGVFARAIHDPDYARNLILCRDTPAFRDFLIDQARDWAPPAEELPAHDARELTSKAALSFWEWTKSGFSLLDEEAHAGRFSACLACPHLVAPPASLLYRLIGAGDADRKRICGLCGCVAYRKARYPHERCPGADPDRPGLNRWGQTMAQEVPVAAADPR